MVSGVREARRLLAQMRNGDEAAAAAHGSALPSKVCGRFFQIQICRLLSGWRLTHLPDKRQK
jgi:hypothetical protein